MTGDSPGPWTHFRSRASARVYARSLGAVRAIQSVWISGDLTGLAPLLHDDAELVVDTGGRVPAPESVRGRTPAVRALARVLSGREVAATTIHSVNGSAGLALRDADCQVIGIITVDVRRRVVSSIWVVLNPEKLRHWN